jgi:hypothetical protein
MLLENILHEKYIKYLKLKNIPFEHESRILNGVIDFKINLEEKIIGIEVKADRSNLFSALGQLINAKRTFSDVYLLSTEEFYNTIYDIFLELGLQDQFGFIIVKDGDFVTLSKPKTKQYYFNERFYKPPKTKKTKALVLDKEITDFLEKYKDKPFFCSDVAKEMNISMTNAQARIARLRRFGLVEEVKHIGIPKPFKVLKIPKEEYIYI